MDKTRVVLSIFYTYYSVKVSTLFKRTEEVKKELKRTYLKDRVQELNKGIIAAAPFLIELTSRLVEDEE